MQYRQAGDGGRGGRSSMCRLSREQKKSAGMSYDELDTQSLSTTESGRHVSTAKLRAGHRASNHCFYFMCPQALFLSDSSPPRGALKSRITKSLESFPDKFKGGRIESCRAVSIREPSRRRNGNGVCDNRINLEIQDSIRVAFGSCVLRMSYFVSFFPSLGIVTLC